MPQNICRDNVNDNLENLDDFKRLKKSQLPLKLSTGTMMGTMKSKATKMGILMGKINYQTLMAPNLFLLSNSFWLTFHLFNPSSPFSIQTNLPLFSHQPFNMPPLCESPQPIIYSDKYFLPRGDLYIFVDNTMFRVHHYLLARDSETICYKLEIAESDPKNSEYTGNVQTNPLILQNKFTNPHTFHLLLSIIYNPQYNVYEGYTWRDWFDILYITNENTTDLVMCLHEDTWEYSIGI